MSFVGFPLSALFLGLGTLLIGNGLLSLLLSLKAGQAFGETVTGIVMGGYFLGFVAGSFLVPRIVRSVGYIRTFAALAALASVVAVAHGVVLDPAAWLVFRVLSGICLAGIYLVVESWINAQSSNAQRGRVFALYMTVTLAALGLGLLLGPLAGSSASVEPFVLASVLFTLGLIPVAVTPMPQPEPPAVPVSRPGRLFAVSPTGFFGAAIAGLVNGVLWGLGPVFWRGLGLTEAEAGQFMALVIAGGVVLQWPIGHFSDGRDRRWVLGGVCLAAAAAALLTLIAIELSRVWLAACAFAYGGFMLTVYSLSVAHVNDRASPTEVVEAARTLLLLYGVGAAIGPMLAGVLLESFGPTTLPVFSAVLLLSLAGVALQQVLTKDRVAFEEQVTFVPLTRTSPVALDVLPEAGIPASQGTGTERSG